MFRPNTWFLIQCGSAETDPSEPECDQKSTEIVVLRSLVVPAVLGEKSSSNLIFIPANDVKDSLKLRPNCTKSSMLEDCYFIGFESGTPRGSGEKSRKQGRPAHFGDLFINKTLKTVYN
jgi:hypothetical protein